LKRNFSAVREGMPLVLAVGVVAAVSVVVFWPVAVCMALVALWILYFFRDPARATPPADGVLLAPVDGRIVEARPPGDGQSGRVAVFMSLFDVHVVRAPCGGVVRIVRHVPGRHKNAASRAAATMNEYVRVELDGDGPAVTVRMIAGVVARRIVCTLEPGDTVRAGDKIGMIKFGSRLEVAVPEGWRPQVAEGDRVRGGVTVIGVAE